MHALCVVYTWIPPWTTCVCEGALACPGTYVQVTAYCIQQSPLFAWKKGMKAPDRSMHAARVAPKPCSSCPDASHSLFIGSDDAALGMFFFYHDTHEWRRTGAETSLISCKIKLLDLILCDSIFFWFVMAGRFYVTFKHTRELVHDRPYGSGHFLSWATSADRSDQRSSGVSSTGELNRPDVIVQMYSNNLSSSSITPSYLNARKFVRCGKNLSVNAHENYGDDGRCVWWSKEESYQSLANNSSDGTRSREAWCDRERIHIGVCNETRRLQIMSTYKRNNMKWDPVGFILFMHVIDFLPLVSCAILLLLRFCWISFSRHGKLNRQRVHICCRYNTTSSTFHLGFSAASSCRYWLTWNAW
jgi:hypothetical protein